MLALTIVVLATAACGVAFAQGAGDAPDGDQYGGSTGPADGVYRVCSGDEASGGRSCEPAPYLGLSGPEDFDYCDEGGCLILGPSGKAFFSCDAGGNCEYLAHPDAVGGDFDRCEMSGASGEDQHEVGRCYVCGPTGVCPEVAGYACDASGLCAYSMFGGSGGLADAGQYGGGGDATPDAGDSARQALDALRDARSGDRNPDPGVALAQEDPGEGPSGGPASPSAPPREDDRENPDEPRPGPNGPEDGTLREPSGADADDPDSEARGEGPNGDVADEDDAAADGAAEGDTGTEEAEAEARGGAEDRGEAGPLAVEGDGGLSLRSGGLPLVFMGAVVVLLAAGGLLVFRVLR